MLRVVIVAALDWAAALHLAMALERHRRQCRADGTALPAVLEDVARAALATAKGASECQEAPSLNGRGDILDTSAMHVRAAPMLLTVDDAAQELNLSRRSVHRLIESGELPSAKVGGARRVRRVDLEAWVDSLGSAGPMRGRIETKAEEADADGGRP